MSEKDSKEYYHNKGQADRSNGDYDSPGSAISAFTKTDSEIEKEIENDEAYNQGWNNADKN